MFSTQSDFQDDQWQHSWTWLSSTNIYSASQFLLPDMKDQSNTCNKTQWLAVPSSLFLTVCAASRFLSVSLGSVLMTKLWSWISLLPETSSVEFSKCVCSWRMIFWNIIEDLQESSSSCWEGRTVLFHCFLHLPNILLYHLLFYFQEELSLWPSVTCTGGIRCQFSWLLWSVYFTSERICLHILFSN